MTTEKMPERYAHQVGERLRHIRRQKGLSLQTVEDTSKQEFKASVLGAYERGERDISVMRLHRLARFYGVPIDQLLPRDTAPVASAPEPLRSNSSGQLDPTPEPVTIDLHRLEQLEAPEKDLISRYVGMIQIQRGDFNGRVLTLRETDLWALGRVYQRGAASMRDRMRELGILF
jgi:transcriptional regulator with XRE-family HTH domain